MQPDQPSPPENPADEAEEAGSTEIINQEHGLISSSQTRSYECNFCKRGFTNAQALGGHMNIHRKEKARLKQASSDHDLTNYNYLAKNIISSSPNSSSSIPLPIPISAFLPLEVNPRDEIANLIKFPWDSTALDGKDHHHHNQTLVDDDLIHRQLPLFTETSLSDTNQGFDTDDRVEIIPGPPGTTRSSSDSELDLELRLGPEPKDSSSAGTGTRHFF